MNGQIGFMQGRLSPLVDGRIQAFPWQDWRREFSLAEAHGFSLMEWTLDQDRLYENPLLTSDGQKEIIDLCRRHSVGVSSLTGDCFMQAPFWKASGGHMKSLQDDFIAITDACATTGIKMIVVPLVDNGRLDNRHQEDVLIDFLEQNSPYLAAKGLQVVFESDFAPQELARFIERLAPELFGINYDIGNSAAIGYSPAEEFAAYGPRIRNVHVKDRVQGGTTVALGAGSANFDAVFFGLSQMGYEGDFILQTARSADDRHAEVLKIYREMTKQWIAKYGT